MFINKIGSHHVEYGNNCQDFGNIDEEAFILSPLHGNKTIKSEVKIVCDGCSEGTDTEVGAKTFIHLMKQSAYNIKIVFNKLIDIFGQSVDFKKNFLTFTILYSIEDEESFNVYNCGDGFCILLNKQGEIEFVKFDCGEFPEYYVYNYIDAKYLKKYSEGVQLHESKFSKDEYQKVGVASDGIRFVFEQSEEFQDKFKQLLINNKTGAMKRFINMNKQVFKDDITIAF